MGRALEPAAADFNHGDEVYWFVRDGDWMLYGSHLPSIDEHTFRGRGPP